MDVVVSKQSEARKKKTEQIIKCSFVYLTICTVYCTGRTLAPGRWKLSLSFSRLLHSENMGCSWFLVHRRQCRRRLSRRLVVLLLGIPRRHVHLGEHRHRLLEHPLAASARLGPRTPRPKMPRVALEESNTEPPRRPRRDRGLDVHLDSSLDTFISKFSIWVGASRTGTQQAKPDDLPSSPSSPAKPTKAEPLAASSTRPPIRECVASTSARGAEPPTSAGWL
ncbi:hypothetical protein U9M48_000275 [Paspalum notatum var. saurae]|uniref:Uncharacterized protein n=1 Tax=Paspalum notatum var. saurae TaxID=547442 RepID=A0AAQ3PDX0_PASNO